MPSMSSHMAIAFNIYDKLPVKKEEFIKGNLLPDLYNNKIKSHYKIQGKKYMIPDIERVVKEFDLRDSMFLGYLSHLLLDKYFLEDYLDKIDINVFDNNLIYDDYDILNQEVINYFKLDKKYIKEIMNNFPSDINPNKLINNLDCLDKTSNNKTKLLNKEEFIKFLETTSLKIENDIKEIIKNNK